MTKPRLLTVISMFITLFSFAQQNENTITSKTASTDVKKNRVKTEISKTPASQTKPANEKTGSIEKAQELTPRKKEESTINQYNPSK